MVELDGKVVFVTGSSRGIGRAIALEAARCGASVVVHYRTERAPAEELVRTIEVEGGRAAAVQADLGDVAAIAACAGEAWDAFGRVDVLVNSAGINLKKRFLETDVEEIDAIYRVNVRGTLVCTAEIVRRMRDTGIRGRVLTITSINAIRAGVGFSTYGGAKAWLEMAMKNIALELAPHGILVNTFPVGAIRTDMTRGYWEDPAASERVNAGIALRRFGEPEEIARTVVAFAGDAGDYATGSSIVVDGGLSLVRGIPDITR